MGTSTTIKTSRVRFGRRMYFFDVKSSQKNKKFLKITESCFEGEGKERKYNSFILFPENVKEFQKFLGESVDSLTNA